MLLFDFREIGNKLPNIRKKAGLTQSEVAKATDGELNRCSYKERETAL